MTMITLEGEDGKTPNSEIEKLYALEFVPMRIPVLFVYCGKYLSPCAKVVYMTLASFANKSGLCFPSNDQLQQRSGYGKTAITDALNELRYFGYLAWETKKARWSSKHKKFVKNNYYTLLTPPMQLKPTRQEAQRYKSLYKKKNSGSAGFGKTRVKSARAVYN